MKTMIHPRDPYRMNWIEGRREWGTVTALPAGLSVSVESVSEGELVRERYTFTNVTDRYVFTSRDSVGIATPFNDNYEDAAVCLRERCHTHLFCGGEVSYVMALRMGGEGPHLGLVLTEGSLCGYSVERDLSQISNDRGDFILHPSPVALLAPGESFSLAWTLFWHEGPEDFYRRLPLLNPRHLEVRARRYVLFTGETLHLTVTPAFPLGDGEVSVSLGEKELPFERADGVIRVDHLCETAGELVLRLSVGGVRTSCRVLVCPPIHELAEARCRFIANHQQVSAPHTPLDGAYLIYDNEDGHLVTSPTPDFNTGRERVGMGALLATYLRDRPDPVLEESLWRYKTFVDRELVDTATGHVSHDYGHFDPFLRLYNYTWAANFYLAVYRLRGHREDLLIALRIMERFYALGGESYYALMVPVLPLLEGLEAEGLSAEREAILTRFRAHGDTLLRIGTDYPPHEVRLEQAIVAPAAQLMLDLYEATGDECYRTAAHEQMRILELFNGRQPDWHLCEVSIRHWDGYWFGKRRTYGDTFPHYWSALTACCLESYANLTGRADYRDRAEDAFRGVLGLIHPDGRGFCAYVFPLTVNGNRGEFFDPYANDQDWALYFYLEHGRRGESHPPRH